MEVVEAARQLESRLPTVTVFDELNVGAVCVNAAIGRQTTAILR
jgi:hypothetical protein